MCVCVHVCVRVHTHLWVGGGGGAVLWDGALNLWILMLSLGGWCQM